MALNHRGQKHFSSFCDRFETARVLIRDSPPTFDLSTIINMNVTRMLSNKENAPDLAAASS